MRARYVGSLLPISTTTTDPERTYPWERLTRNAPGSTTRYRAGRSRSPSGWTAPSLRTTSSLNIRYVLMMFSRPFRLHLLHLCSLVRRFSGSVRKFATQAARLVSVLTENPPARHTEFSLGTVAATGAFFPSIISRLRLLKIAAQVRITARRIWIRYTKAYPWKNTFVSAWAALRC